MTLQGSKYLKCALASMLAIAVGHIGCAAEGDDPRCVGARCDALGDSEFEYIVVGSGAGGGPLASRLARAGHKTLLLEAGDDAGGKALTYQIPAFHGAATEDPALAWSYFVKHYDDADRRQRDSKFTCQNDAGQLAACEMQSGGLCECPPSHPNELGILYPRGATLGGSTAVSALISVVPSNSDWDGIAEDTGDASWSAANMAKYYDRTREWLQLSTSDPTIGLTDLKVVTILVSAVIEFVKRGWSEGPSMDVLNILGNVAALKNVLLGDLNESILAGEDGEGMWSFPLAMDKRGRRNGPREFILDTVAQGFPLTVRTGALVTKVVLDETGKAPVARGVVYLDGRHLYKADPNQSASSKKEVKVTAVREVILSAGAFNSPQLLMLSGIGPRKQLEAQGIDVAVDLPGVGQNLQDRYEVGLVYEARKDFSVLGGCTFQADANDPCFAEWKQEGEGLYASNGSITSMLRRSDSAKLNPDLHMFGLPGSFRGYYPSYSADVVANRNLFTWVILKAHTNNRGGQVSLRSSDPTDWPEINFRYFDDGERSPGESADDLAAVVEAIEFIRDISDRTDTLFTLTGGFDEVWPGSDVDSREAIADWIKRESWGHHASCTNKIGSETDDMAVLDSAFRVRGVGGLRVVDASVFPRIPGTFIALPTFMVSEKAADVILGGISAK